MMKDIAGMRIVIVVLLSLIIAHLLRITAVRPIITARMTGITGVMSVIVPDDVVHRRDDVAHHRHHRAADRPGSRPSDGPPIASVTRRSARPTCR
jgi:hypothetical protein